MMVVHCTFFPLMVDFKKVIPLQKEIYAVLTYKERLVLSCCILPYSDAKSQNHAQSVSNSLSP